MSSTRKFSRSMLLYQLKNPATQLAIKNNSHSRIFDDLPDTSCIFADIEDDEDTILPMLMLVPDDTIVFGDKGFEFTRPQDIREITEWAQAVLAHAANIMLTKDNKIDSRLKQVIGKNKHDLSAHDLLFAFLARNAMQLQLRMHEHTMPEIMPYDFESEEHVKRTPVHPFEKSFVAFTAMVNLCSSRWIEELFERRCPKPIISYTDFAIGLAIGAGAFLLFGGATAAVVAANSPKNDNSQPKPPPSPGS